MRERETVTERERDRQGDISCTPVGWPWPAVWWLLHVSYSLTFLESVLSLIHTHKHSQNTAHKHAPARQHTANKRPQIIYLLFCYFWGLLAFRTLWRLLGMQQGMKRVLIRCRVQVHKWALKSSDFWFKEFFHWTSSVLIHRATSLTKIIWIIKTFNQCLCRTNY